MSCIKSDAPLPTSSAISQATGDRESGSTQVTQRLCRSCNGIHPAIPQQPWEIDDPDARQKALRTLDDARLSRSIETTNLAINHSLEVHHHACTSGLPYSYHELFHRTKLYTATVKGLVSVLRMLGTSSTNFRAAETATLLVDFSSTVLRSDKIKFHYFLNSQRKGIYWILDDALLHICLDLWEDGKSNTPWDKLISPINLALSSTQEKLDEWSEIDMSMYNHLQRISYNLQEPRVFMQGYFERTLAFLRDSIRIYEIWRTVRLSGIGRLPIELANVIIMDVFESEKLPIGDLRQLYLFKGKGTA